MILTTNKPTFEGSVPNQITNWQINGNDLAGQVIVTTQSPYTDETILGKVVFANPKTRPYFVVVTDDRKLLIEVSGDASSDPTGFQVGVPNGEDRKLSGYHRFTYQVFEYDAEPTEE